jgi:putative membrane protein
MTMKLNKWILGVFAVCALASCDKDDELPGTTNQDKDFMTKVAYADNGEIEEGNIAFTKASFRDVKDFAAVMVTDHNKSKGDLKAMAEELGIRGLPDMPDVPHLERQVVLKSLSGRAFDSAYMRTQLADHLTAISLYQNEITNGSDLKVLEFANNKLPIIQMHKMMVDSLIHVHGF